MAQHEQYVNITDQTTFAAWVRQEGRVRLFNIMLAFDAAMAIFNNVPPRITFSELDLMLPCEQVFWETTCHDDLITHGVMPRPRMKLLDAFQMLFTPAAEVQSAMEKYSWNSWDMMYLIHLLYVHVWRQTFSNPLLRKSIFHTPAPANILDPLKTALRNWKAMWDDVRSKLTDEQLQGMGFETSSDSYWTLTRLVVQAFDTSSRGGNGALSASESVSSPRDPGGSPVPRQQQPPAPRSGPLVQQPAALSGQPVYPDPGVIQSPTQAMELNGAYSNYAAYPINATPGMIPANPNMSSLNGMMTNVPPNVAMSMDVDQRLTVVPVKAEQEVVHASGLPPGLGFSGNYTTTASEPASATATEFGAQGSSAGFDYMPFEADCDVQGAHLRKIIKRVR
jgi:hypothetical protein